jgi:membrane-associated phospholipid phosphatase
MFENLYYIQKNNTNVIDLIGFNGPIILFLVSVINLWKQKYIYGYLLFYIINTFINNLLKNTIKQARPNNTMNTITEKYPGLHKYGMPSYHAQSVFFSLTFLYLVKRSVFLLLIESFIVFITVYQRWINHHHTIEQLVVGSIIGIINAYIGYIVTRQYISTSII